MSIEFILVMVFISCSVAILPSFVAFLSDLVSVRFLQNAPLSWKEEVRTSKLVTVWVFGLSAFINLLLAVYWITQLNRSRPPYGLMLTADFALAALTFFLTMVITRRVSLSPIITGLISFGLSVILAT